MLSLVLAGLITLPFQPPQEGIPAERGIVHEAYAQAAETAQPPFINRQPPSPLNEEPPENRPDGDAVTWIAGYWHFDDTRDDFIWVSGFWRQVPPGRRWVDGRFVAFTNPQRWRWQAGFWQDTDPSPQQIVPDMPPVVAEAGPSTPAPSANMFWSSGYQSWRGNRWLWRSGSWMNCRPGWVWYPSTWIWSPRGFVFVPGYWDYPLEYRGLLYAPMYYSSSLYLRPGFRHQPRIILCHDDFSGGLFRRNGYGNYYYGNYFGASFAGRGFSFWAAQGSPGRFDPLVGYYRQNRDPAWFQSVQTYGRLRAEGRQAMAPAPLQMASQTNLHPTMINNTFNNTVNNNLPGNPGKPSGPVPRPQGDGVRLLSTEKGARVDLRSGREVPPRDATGQPGKTRPIPPAVNARTPVTNTPAKTGAVVDLAPRGTPRPVTEKPGQPGSLLPPATTDIKPLAPRQPAIANPTPVKPAEVKPPAPRQPAIANPAPVKPAEVKPPTPRQPTIANPATVKPAEVKPLAPRQPAIANPTPVKPAEVKPPAPRQPTPQPATGGSRSPERVSATGRARETAGPSPAPASSRGSEKPKKDTANHR